MAVLSSAVQGEPSPVRALCVGAYQLSASDSLRLADDSIAVLDALIIEIPVVGGHLIDSRS